MKVAETERNSIFRFKDSDTRLNPERVVRKVEKIFVKGGKRVIVFIKLRRTLCFCFLMCGLCM